MSKGVPTQLVAFPGNEEGTLGKLVYDIHHNPTRVGLKQVAPTAIQLLHIAAHLDLIERLILPSLEAGTTVVLDRFWWSTKVYGLASGVLRKALDAMIGVEQAAWAGVKPTCVFLVTRKIPLRAEPQALWQRWSELYEELAIEQQRYEPVARIGNDGSLSATLDSLWAALEAAEKEHGGGNAQLGLFQDGPEQRRAQYSFSGLSPARPTIVYDTYWRFAAERQATFFRRLRGLPPPWTNDPILAEYKFTNAYRASDRVSQYLIREVIYRGDQAPEEIFFRTILFKLFNKIETWELLSRSLGEITYRNFDLKGYDRILLEAMSRKEPIYSAAYIMPSGGTAFNTTRKHRAHLKLLERMMDDEVPLRIAAAPRMLDAFKILRSYPMIGDFLAYQYTTDLNYSDLTNFSEMEFVVPGPGARAGISKCFESLGGLSEVDIIRVVTESQDREFERLGINFQSLWGRPLQLIDCQNLFCEVDKYSRVRHPDVSGSSQRTRIKQRFRADPGLIDYFYPPKWGINASVKAAKRADIKRGSHL